MCCFSNAPQFDAVSGTQIFARLQPENRQIIAYSMTVSAREPLAMILPIPVPPGSAEDAVTFIDLEAYPDLFDDLNKGFPRPLPRGGGPLTQSLGLPVPAMLKVHQVGAFEASFVPSVADFDRLDPRFSLRRDIWDQLPLYADYGFAVFKLKSFEKKPWYAFFSKQASQEKTFHPMAFSFPTRSPDRLFFPTVHIHDGQVHEAAEFDHTLYCQAPGHDTALEAQGWRGSRGLASAFADIEKSAGVVLGEALCHREKQVGTLPNQDTWVPLC